MSGEGTSPSRLRPKMVIPYTDDMVAGICSMDDFYKCTGLREFVTDRTITDVSQVWMNRKACEELEDIVERNLRKQKKYKHWSDRVLRNSVAMDWLCYSPVSYDDVPRGELWIWSLEDAKEAMKEQRERNKENQK